MELQRYWAVIWKWLWLIVIGIVVAGVISYIISWRMAPVYQATATIVVRETADPILSYEYSKSDVATHAQLIKKQSVMEEVINRLALPYSAAELEGKISTSTNANNNAGTPLIKVSAKDTDPLLAQQIADTTVAVYIEQHYEKLQADAEASLSLIQSDINQTSAQIDVLELRKNTVGLTPEEEDELVAFKDNLQQLKSLRTRWNSQLAQALAAGGISLSEPASLPTSPVSPKTTLNVVLACILGLVVTTGGVFLNEYLDRSIKTAEDISKLTGLSVLGAVARFKTIEGKEE